jgi:hypothetical protein
MLISTDEVYLNNTEEKGEEEAREKTINHYKQYLFLHPHSLHGAFK